MTFFRSLITAHLLIAVSAGNCLAADKFLGTWSSGTKEVLNVIKEGESLNAVFFRENVKKEFEQIRFPATVQDGALIISGEQGNLSAKYDEDKKQLVLGGMKTFQRLSKEQAIALIESLRQ